MAVMGDGKPEEFGVLIDISKPFAMFAPLFVIPEAALQNVGHFILLVKPWELFGETRVTPQFSCQQNPISSKSRGQCACGTNFSTLTAPYTSVNVDDRHFFRVLQADCIFSARVYTKSAL